MFLNQANIQAKSYDQRINQSSDLNHVGLRAGVQFDGPEVLQLDIPAAFQEMDKNLESLGLSVSSLCDRIGPICEGGSVVQNMPPTGPADPQRSTAMAETMAGYNRRIQSIEAIVCAALQRLAL